MHIKKHWILFSLFTGKFLWKIVLLCWSLIILTILIMVAVIFPLQKNLALDRMDNEAQDIASTIIIANSSALIMSDYGMVVDYCIDLIGKSNSIQYLVITRKDGYSILFTKGGWEQTTLSGMWNPDTTMLLSRSMYSPLVKKSIFHKTAHFTYLGIHWGYVHVGLSLDNYRASLSKTIAYMTWGTVLMACVGFAISVYFAQRITSPIRILDQAAKRIAKGDLNTHAEIHTGDEHESLSDSFNIMTDSLRKERENLEAKVQERTYLLQQKNEELIQEITTRQKIEEALEKYTKRLEGLQGIYRGIIAAKSITDILVETFKHLSALMSKFQTAYLILYANDQNEMVIHRYEPHGPGLKKIREKPFNLETADELGVMPEICIEDDLNSKESLNGIETFLLKQGYRSFVRYLLRFKEELIGQFIFTSVNLRQFTEEDGVIISQISKQLTVAFTQARLQTDLRKQAFSLRNSLEEKEILLKEVHHRVKNNLQIISSLLYLQSRELTDDRMITVFKDSQTRIRSMSLVHEKLYQSNDLSHIKLKEYIINLSEYIKDTYDHGISPIRFDYDIDDITLPIDTIIPLGLIINELVSNALKYAFNALDFSHDRNNVLSIKLKRQDKQNLVVVIQDNGIGLPEGLDITNTKSLGLKLVNMLSRQIGGRLQVFTANGTQFSIYIPQ